MSKADLWDKLGKTDPRHTKPFKRAGGFSGTAIKPTWAYRRMTEEFGPCGEGWGTGAPTFQVVAGPEGEILVYCTASIWHGNRENVVFGVGGDKAVIKNSSGLRSDDEAFKKAFTDAITNALKMIGVGADVHMGLFDDAKYVNSMTQEFSGDDKAVSEALADRMNYVVDCRTVIKEHDDAEALLAWWSSDEQKQARRNHMLDPEQVASLKQAVMNRRDALTQKAAA